MHCLLLPLLVKTDPVTLKSTRQINLRVSRKTVSLQLTVPPHKQTLWGNRSIEEKYFIFFLRRNMLLINVLLRNNFIKHH